MIRIPKIRPATHPGEMLREEFLKPIGLTQKELADAIHVPFQRINEIVAGKRGLTPEHRSQARQVFRHVTRFLAKSANEVRSASCRDERERRLEIDKTKPRKDFPVTN